jgi:CBS domain-containing protein
MKVGQVCTRHAVTVGPGDSVIDAARTMREEHVGAVVVAESRSGVTAPVGVLTDRDIVVAIVARGIEKIGALEVRDVVVREVVTASDGEDVASALERMCLNASRRVPVVDAAGALVGVLSLDDVIAELSQNLSAAAKIVVAQRRDERRRRG